MNRNLVRTLCLREPGARYRFSLWFSPAAELAVSPSREVPAREAEPAAEPLAITGAAVVDEQSKLVFWALMYATTLLNALSGWAKSEAASLPAAAILIGAGAARWDGNPSDAAAIAAIDLRQMKVHRDDRLWCGIARPGPAQVAEVLSASGPGERLWYWLTDTPGRSDVPLLLQKVTEDPNRDGLNALLDVVEGASPVPAVTGIAYRTEDGGLQFAGRDLKAGHHAALATWVRVNVQQHPDLARLSGCRLALTKDGKVRQVLADDSLWSGIPRPAGAVA